MAASPSRASRRLLARLVQPLPSSPPVLPVAAVNSPAWAGHRHAAESTDATREEASGLTGACPAKAAAAAGVAPRFPAQGGAPCGPHLAGLVRTSVTLLPRPLGCCASLLVPALVSLKGRGLLPRMEPTAPTGFLEASTVQRRRHSGASAAGAGSEQQQEMEFQRRADVTLHALHEQLDVIVDSAPGNEAFDCDHSDGVLTLRLGPHGIYVINKQAPNRQLWLSSPVSGPARFEWSPETEAWLNARDKGTELFLLLQSELRGLLGDSLEVSLSPLAA